MRRILAILFLMPLLSGAQTPYTGGSGDGFAVASLELAPVGTVEQGVGRALLFPSLGKAGTTVNIQGFEGLRSATLVGLSGQRQELSVSGRQFIIPDLPAGYYTVYLQNAGGELAVAKFLLSH